MSRQVYRYVGPAEIANAVPPGSAGHALASPSALATWANTRDLSEPFTFVVDLDGVLRLAPRRSEHVACAGGGPVLGAGEITLARTAGGWAVTEISNQSTGYCPDPGCWPEVAAALDRAGLARPGGFTQRFTFRRCPGCGERNLVKEADFTCALCDADLPEEWNFH